MFRHTIACLLFACGSLGLAQAAPAQPRPRQSQPQPQKVDSLSTAAALARKSAAVAPVAPFRDTLFMIGGMGTFSAAERAASITKKIKTISREGAFSRDSVVVLASGNTVEIIFGDGVIMSVTQADAQQRGMTQLALAGEYQQIIGDAIAAHKAHNDWKYVVRSVALSVTILLVLYLLIRLTGWLYRWVCEKVRRQKGRKIRGIKIRTFRLMDAERETQLIVSAIKIVRIAIVIILFYISIPLILSVFPHTREIADKLFGLVLTPVQKIVTGVVGYIPNLVTIIILVLVFRYLIRGLRYFAEEIDKGRLKIKGFYPDWAHPTMSIIRTLLYVFMFIVIFPYLPGSESRVFQGVSVFIGVVLSLGSSSVIGNIVSGLVLTYMRPFMVGDRIKIGEVVGNVVERTPFVTRIRTPKNEEVTVPNSTILSAQTFNYSHSARNGGLILHREVTFGYDTPWRQVHGLLLEAAARTADVLANPKPFVLQTALDDSYAEYQINVFIDDADKTPAIYSQLNQNIQDVFNEAGVEITTPAYSALRDGNRIAIPDEHLPAGYQPPPFNVKQI